MRGVHRRILSSSLVVVAAALAACGGAPEPAADGGGTPRTPRASALPQTASARVAEPVAGENAASAKRPVEQPGDEVAPAPTSSATGSPSSSKRGNGPTSDAAVSEADVLRNGIALPPIEAPGAVRDIIEAGNTIARSPYLWGGGHGKWLDKGYDCSGSISFALASAGLLGEPLDSGRLDELGRGGQGQVGHDLQQPWPRLHGRRGRALRHVGHPCQRIAMAEVDARGRRLRRPAPAGAVGPTRLAPVAIPSFDITVVRNGPSTRLAPVGELDIATTPALERAITEATREADTALVLDLRELKFMDSSGLRMLAQTNARAESDGFTLSIWRGPPQIDRVLEISGLEAMLPLVDAPAD